MTLLHKPKLPNINVQANLGLSHCIVENDTSFVRAVIKRFNIKFTMRDGVRECNLCH